MEQIKDFVQQMRIERSALTERIEQLDAVLSGLFALYPDLASDDAPDAPETRARRVVRVPQPAKVAAESTQGRMPTKYVLRDVLYQNAGEQLTVDRIISEVKATGWGEEYPDPSAVLRTALRRMAEKREFGVHRDRLDGRAWHYWVVSSNAAHAPMNPESPAGDSAGLSVPIPANQEGGGASGTDTHRVRDDHSSRQAMHLDHGFGAPVVTGA